MKLRKLLAVALATTMMLSLAACGKTEEPNKPDETVTETPTETPDAEEVVNEIYNDGNISVVQDEKIIVTTEGEFGIGLYEDTLVKVTSEDKKVEIESIAPGVTTVTINCTVNEVNYVYYVDVVIEDNLNILGAVRMDSNGEADVNPSIVASDFEDIIATIYANIPEDSHPMTETMTVDIKDTELMTYHFGVAELAGLDSVAISEPMMSSVAYSLAVFKFDTNENANAAIELLEANAPTNKWVCVEAEKVSARVVKDVYVVFTMGATTTVDAIQAVVIE